MRDVKLWWSFGCVAAVLVFGGGCLSSGGGGGDSCPEGRERCACYPNDTCDPGLSCRSNVCVDADGDETDGATDATDAETDEESDSTTDSTDAATEADDTDAKPGSSDGETDAASTDPEETESTTDEQGSDPDEATGTDGVPATDVSETDPAQSDVAETDPAETDVAETDVEVTDPAPTDESTDVTGTTDVAVTDEPTLGGYVEVELISTCSGPRGENFDGAWFAGAGPDSSIYPEDSSGSFTMTSGGYSGSSAVVVGTVASGDYAHVGHVMYRGSDLFDASAYDGISFYARAGEPIDVRVELAQQNSDPFYGLCEEDVSCYNNPALTISVTTEWTRFVVPFADLRTNPDLPGLATTPSTIKHWQFSMPPGDFEFWLDELWFVVEE